MVRILVVTACCAATLGIGIAPTQAGKTLHFTACGNEMKSPGADRYEVTGGVTCGSVGWFVRTQFKSMATGTYKRFAHRYLCGTRAAGGGAQTVQCLKDKRLRRGENQRAFRFRFSR